MSSRRARGWRFGGRGSAPFTASRSAPQRQPPEVYNFTEFCQQILLQNQKFFTEELGKRRRSTLRVVCMDMWAACVNLVRKHAPQAQLLFDRFHIVKHLQEAVDEVRRSEVRRLTGKEKATFKSTRWLLPKNPWNLTNEQKERLSTLVRWNTPIVRAYYLKESFQLFWDYQQEKRAQDLLSKWMNSAMRSRLEPFKKFVRMLRSHLDGISGEE